MKIGILVTGLTIDEIAKNYGQYDDRFAELLAGYDFDFKSFFVVNNEFPESVDACDGWIISGSRHGAYEDHEWIPPLEEFIRKSYAAHIPMIGVCFGHQIIAQALGGKVEKFEGGWVVGRQHYKMADGEQLDVMAWHQDQVIEKPKISEAIGSSDTCEFAALVYDDRILTTQPHPEFDGGYVVELANKRGQGVVPDHLLDVVRSTSDQPIAQKEMAKKFADFLIAKHNKNTGQENGA